jgi:hypothetical protein
VREHFFDLDLVGDQLRKFYWYGYIDYMEKLQNFLIFL